MTRDVVTGDREAELCEHCGRVTARSGVTIVCGPTPSVRVRDVCICE